MYAKFWKRFFDFTLSLLALIVLLPVLILLTVIGAIVLRGNPFFIQERPGKIDESTGKEKIFKLIKFRTMSNKKDADGNLLPDKLRLNRYGCILRSSSLDELPELINIIKGDMSIVGPRPLAVKYLPFYNESERRRHTVLPGLTGLAQINGRNATNWPDRFSYDVKYVDSISLTNDLIIVLKTIGKVVKRGDITVRGTGEIVDFDLYRKQENNKELVGHHE